MNRLAVIGIGSPFGADALALTLVSSLRQRYAMNGVDYLVLDRPGPALLDSLRGRDAAVLLDYCPEISPGSYRLIEADDLAQQHASLSSHGLGVAESLALGKVLGELPASCWLLALGELDPNDVSLQESIFHQIKSLLALS